MAFTAILNYFIFVCQAEHCSFCSVAKSCQTLQLHELQPHQASLSSLYPGACSNSCPLSQWCHPTILSSAALFSSCPQSFPPSESFPVSWLFGLAGQNIGASTLASVLPMNIQGWFPLGLTGLISFMSKGLPRVFFSTTIWSILDKNVPWVRLPGFKSWLCYSMTLCLHLNAWIS